MQLCGPRAWVRKGCFISEIGERFFWGMTRYARYAGTQILMCFGDISCYDDFLYTPIHHVYNCIIYIWYAHYAYMKHGLIYVLLHHNHLYRRRQWKPWKRSERKVCFWSMTRSRAHQRGKNLVVKRNRKTHIVSFWTKTDERICGRLEYGQSMNYNQFLRPTRVQVEKVFGDPKSSLEGTSSPEVCSCSSELSHVSSNMLPRGHGRYTVYVEKKTLARK